MKNVNEMERIAKIIRMAMGMKGVDNNGLMELTGFSRHQVYNYTKPRRAIPKANLDKILIALGVDEDELKLIENLIDK